MPRKNSVSLGALHLENSSRFLSYRKNDLFMEDLCLAESVFECPPETPMFLKISCTFDLFSRVKDFLPDKHMFNEPFPRKDVCGVNST